MIATEPAKSTEDRALADALSQAANNAGLDSAVGIYPDPNDVGKLKVVFFDRKAEHLHPCFNSSDCDYSVLEHSL